MRKAFTWDDFSESARAALHGAQNEAATLEKEVTPAVLLLGLLRDNESLAVKLLTSLGLQSDALVREAESAVSSQPPKSGSGHKVSAPAHRAMQNIYEEAGRIGDNHISTVHILLSILRSRDKTVRRLLHERGITRRKVVGTLATNIAPAEVDGPLGTRRQLDWNRMSEPARKAGWQALVIAKHHGYAESEPETLMLSLVLNPPNAATNLLTRGGIRIDMLKAALISGLAAHSDVTPHAGRISKRTRDVVQLAYAEAERLQDEQVGTQHLLLGILKASPESLRPIFHDFALEYDRLAQVEEDEPRKPES